MAKAVKKVSKPNKRGKYDEKLAVKGTFMDLIQASMKHADNNSKAKKKSE